MTPVNETDPLTFRRLGEHDVAPLRALSTGVWWMETRGSDTVVGLLTNPAMQVYGLFDGAALVATAALLTDGLTKSVLVDVAVRADRRGDGLGHDVVARTMATVPDHLEGILYCRTELEGFYAQHGYRVDDSYTLMLRRNPR